MGHRRMLAPATYVTAICVLTIVVSFEIIFLVIKDQIAAHETGIITTPRGVYDKSKSRAKYYSIVAARIFSTVVFGFMAFICAALLNHESHDNLVNRHIFVLSGILAPIVGLWVFRFREPFRSFIKGYTGSYEERFRNFVQSHLIFMGLVVPAIGLIAILVVRKFS